MTVDSGVLVDHMDRPLRVTDMTGITVAVIFLVMLMFRGKVVRTRLMFVMTLNIITRPRYL